MRYAILLIFLFLLASCSEELPPTPPAPGGEETTVGRAAGLPITKLPTWASSLKYTDIEPTTVKYGDTEKTTVQKPSGFKNKFYVYGFKYVYNKKFGIWEKLPANTGQSGKIIKDWVEDKAVFLLPVTSDRFPEGPNFEVVYTCSDTGNRDNNSKIIWDCNGNKWMIAAFNVGERYPNILFEEKIGTNNYTRSSKSTSSDGDVYEAEYVDTSNVKTIAQVIDLKNSAAYKSNLAGAYLTLYNQWTNRSNVCGFLTSGSNEVKFSWLSGKYWVTIKTLSTAVDDSKITKYNTRYNSNCNLLNELSNVTAPVVNVTNATNVVVTKTSVPNPVMNGTQLNYTIVVRNTGNVAATNVVLVENYPAGAAFHSSSPSPTSGNNIFSLGTLSANSLVTINILVNTSSALANNTLLNNTVNVTYSNTSGGQAITTSQFTPVISSVTTPPVQQPPFTNVLITKTAPTLVKNGTQINYTITVSNLGTGNATNVVVTENYPVGYIAADVVIPDSVVFDSSSPSPTSGDNIFNISTLAANSVTTIRITANASSELSDGMILNNTVYVKFTNSTGNHTIYASAVTTVLVPTQFAGKITTCSLDRGTGVFPGIAWYSQGPCAYGSCPATQCDSSVTSANIVPCSMSQVNSSCYQPIGTAYYKWTCIQSAKCIPEGCPSGMTDLGIIDEYNAQGQWYNGYRICQLGNVQGEIISCQGSSCTLPSCSKGTLQDQFSEYDQSAVFAKFGICSDQSIALASCQQSVKGRTCVTSQPAGKTRFENYVIDINWVTSASRTFTYWDFYGAVPQIYSTLSPREDVHVIDYHQIRQPITGFASISNEAMPITNYVILDSPSPRSTQLALTFLAAFGILLIVLLNFTHKDE